MLLVLNEALQNDSSTTDLDKKISDKKIKDTCYNVFNNNNSFFAHGENILVLMLSDSDEFV